jgi:hypothetical protein
MHVMFMCMQERVFVYVHVNVCFHAYVRACMNKHVFVLCTERSVIYVRVCVCVCVFKYIYFLVHIKNFFPLYS